MALSALSISSRRILTALALSSPAIFQGCGGVGDTDTRQGASEVQEVTQGPKDGHDLPPTDLDRVALGTRAPDFTLRSLRGERYTLSEYRGKKNVILVFYRGHW